MPTPVLIFPDLVEGMGILFEPARTKFTEIEKSLSIECVKFADKNKYPYIRVLLKLGCTMP